ncbi:MAG TPA: hypothetical protein VF708_06870 [Pyrinomonadaceae bacterium]|jgi:hypothetical protein
MLKLRLITFALALNLLVALSVPAQTVNLEDLYVKGNKVSYNGYEVTRSFNESTQLSWASISKGGRLLVSFKDGGGPSLDFTNIALFSLLGGEGKQLIINQHSGGAHCCNSVWIYDLAAPRLRKLYDNLTYDVDFSPLLIDIDHDGVYEFTQSVMAFDYFDRLSHASSPFAQVAFKYDKSAGRYLPASRTHADYLLRDIGKYIDEVNKANRELASTRHEDDVGDYLGTVLQVVLQYIYAGREQEGWDFYEREYRLDDKAQMRTKVKGVLRKSVVYNSIYGRTNRRGSS